MSSAAEIKIAALLSSITDPEVPVLTIEDLGILRGVEILELTDTGQAQHVRVTITPTYSGCPAMDIISMQIRMLLLSYGIKEVSIVQQLYPAWTTDWLSEEGRKKLEEYGIAAPQYQTKESRSALFSEDEPPCPKCGATTTTQVSAFSGTACKALYKCDACKEPFEYFKCH